MALNGGLAEQIDRIRVGSGRVGAHTRGRFQALASAHQEHLVRRDHAAFSLDRFLQLGDTAQKKRNRVNNWWWPTGGVKKKEKKGRVVESRIKRIFKVFKFEKLKFLQGTIVRTISIPFDSPCYKILLHLIRELKVTKRIQNIGFHNFQDS